MNECGERRKRGREFDISGNKLILLNGPSSAGKSTIAAELREKLRRCGADPAVISIDHYMKIGTDEEIWEDDVFEIMPDMCRDITPALRQGKWVIVDHVITSERIYEALRKAAEGFGTVEVLVSCSLETLRKREKERGNRFPGSAETSLRYLYPADGYDLRIDSGKTGPAASAERILAFLAGESSGAGFPYRAVIVDLDRTLLRTDKTVSAYTLEVLAKCRDAGAYLYAATARPERAIADYRRIIDFRSVTTLNGARTIMPDGAEEAAIDSRSAAEVLEQLYRTEGTVISAETDGGLFANREIAIWNPTVLDDIRSVADHRKIYKILASHPGMDAERLHVSLPEGTYCTVADRELLQVMGSGATKWNGIRRMLDRDGISPEQAVYFGDENDDIEPLRKCGCGVAVGNALPCVKEAADAVAPCNDEDGVAVFLAERLAEQE